MKKNRLTWIPVTSHSKENLTEQKRNKGLLAALRPPQWDYVKQFLSIKTFIKTDSYACIFAALFMPYGTLAYSGYAFVFYVFAYSPYRAPIFSATRMRN